MSVAGLARRFRTDFVEPFDCQSLAIYRTLKAEAERGWKRSGFRALPILFFPDIQIILTAWLQLRLERQLGVARDDLTAANPDFPFSGLADLDNGPRPESKRYAGAVAQRQGNRSIKHILAEILLQRPYRRPAIGFLFDINFGTLPVIKAILRTGGWPVAIPSAPLGGVDFDEEWPRLRSALDAALAEFEVSTGPRRNLLEVVANHIRASLSGTPALLNCDILVCGSTSVLDTRMVAAQARLQGIPVVSVTHGESDGALDEPYFSYGEYTYPTHLISFGTAATEAYERSDYMRCLFEPDHRPIFVPSSADTVRPRFASDRPIRAFPRGEARCGLYVPSLFAGNLLYGPFRTLPDILYHRWQLHLLEQFPDCRIKGHPNSNWPEAIYPEGRWLGGKLTELLDEADYFIYDYVSTALTQAMATDRPILFFDIGLNHLDAEAAGAIRERCNVIRVEDLTDTTLAAKAMAAAGQICVNRFTPRFSLDGSGEPRIAALERTLGQLVGAS